MIRAILTTTSWKFMQRRTLLKVGAATAAVVAITGGGLALLQPGLLRGRLTAAGFEVFRAVARAVLDGSLPTQAAQREATLLAHLHRLDDAIAAFPATTQAELSQLLALLASTAGRIGLAGLRARWPEASVAELQQALEGLRVSSVALRQQVYFALRDLTNAAFYADPAAWRLLGYPGPRAI